jgi:hypothetical protein
MDRNIIWKLNLFLPLAVVLRNRLVSKQWCAALSATAHWRPILATEFASLQSVCVPAHVDQTLLPIPGVDADTCRAMWWYYLAYCVPLKDVCSVGLADNADSVCGLWVLPSLSLRELHAPYFGTLSDLQWRRVERAQCYDLRPTLPSVRSWHGSLYLPHVLKLELLTLDEVEKLAHVNVL